jgi:hypothetical protein
VGDLFVHGAASFRISTDQDKSTAGNINASWMPPTFLVMPPPVSSGNSQHLFEKAADGKAYTMMTGTNAKAGDYEGHVAIIYIVGYKLHTLKVLHAL